MRVLDLAIVFGMIGEATLPGAAPPAPPIDSPRIAALQRAVQTGDKTAVDTFCREVKGKAPIVEAIPGTDAEVWATYLWMGNKDTERVAVVGGVPIAVMKELARVLAPDGIRVNAIAPGAIPGGGFVADNLAELVAQIPLGRAGTPDDIAQVAVAVLSERFGRYVVDTTVDVDGGGLGLIS